MAEIENGKPAGEILMEERRLGSVLKEIGSQILTNAQEVRKNRATVTGTQRYISDEYSSVPKSFEELVDLAGGMGKLRLAGKLYQFTLARLRQLERLARSPYFGRIDFAEASAENKFAQPIYIGISSLMAAETGEHLVFDWRAPVSSVYYDYELGYAQYESPRGTVSGEVLLKRHFKIQGDKILLMYDNNLTIFDEILQDTLGKATGDRMKNIVNTIQREQNRIIRDEGRNVLLVQGCAGSGKTSIALHRAAYLLYKHRKDMGGENILMITPNRIFEDYTSPVLPELGEEPLSQTSFTDIASELLKAGGGETYTERIEEFADQLEQLFESQGTNRHSVLDAGIRLKSSDEFALALKSYGDMLANREFRFADLVYRGKILVSQDEIASLIGSEYAYLPVVKRVEKAKRRMMWIMDAAQSERVDELKAEIAAGPDSVHLFKRDIEERAANRAYEEMRPLRERVLSWEPLSYYRAYRRFYAEDASHWVRNFAGANSLKRWDAAILQSICRETVERLDAGIIAYEDLAPMVYLKGILDGVQESPQIRHVIVDEAQDYNAIQYRVLKMAFPRASFTVLGDLNQIISPSGSAEGYESALRGLGADQRSQYVRLEKSYRSTKEITEFTKGILEGGQPVEAIERPGEAPLLVRSDDGPDLAASIAADIQSLRQEGYKSIAVICRTARESWVAHEHLKPLLKSVHLVTKEQRRFIRGTLVIPSYLAKGLEFEAVLIYDAGAASYAQPDDRLVLYTACTRALHKLHIHYTGDLSPFISGAGHKI